MNNQQAINLLKGLEKNLDDYCELNDEGKTAFGMAIAALELFGNSEQLPSAQPEPRTAYWTKDIVGSVVCSNCGGIRRDNRIGHTQWCNCCGYFMRGEQE